MRRTFLDKLIGYFSPRTEANRIKARVQAEMNQRAYDIAKNFTQSDWTSTSTNDAKQEIKAAIGPGREKARALTQNAPYALRAVDVIVNETVGTGIELSIKGRTKTITKQLQALWKEWAESTACDYSGRNNFYSLQVLIMKSIVESGETLILRKMDKDGLKLRMYESDFLVTIQDYAPYVQGIKFDDQGRRVSYQFYKTHPGAKIANVETIDIPAAEVIHAFRQGRPGQERGVTWAHAIIERMKDYDDYKGATLIRQKIAACFSAFVTTNGNDSLVDATTLKQKRQAEFDLEPATVRYLNQGEDIKLSSPPGIEGFADINREYIREIASGWGISYESLSGDYSQSNYSSSRMGQIQMRKNIESWRWNMFIPQVCEPIFQWFLSYAKLKGIDIKDAESRWICPAYTLIDPDKEISATIKEVRSGLKTWGDAIREQGLDPEEQLLQIAETNKLLDDNQVVLDIDPRRLTQVGIVQANNPLALLSQVSDNNTNPQGDNSNANSSNNEAPASNPSSSSSDQPKKP